MRDTLKTMHDIERLVARAALGTAGPRDLVSLRQSIAAVPRVRMLLDEFQAPLVRSLAAELDDLADLRDELDRTLLDEPPVMARDGGVVRDGVDAELDDLRGISRSGKQRIAEMEEAERARTGISSLKIRYNRVFGYYIEISKSNLANVPADYHRKADDCRRRALHHAGAEGVRGEGARRRRADPRARGRDFRGAARARRRRGAARSRTPREGWRRSTCSAALAETAALQNYTSP